MARCRTSEVVFKGASNKGTHKGGIVVAQYCFERQAEVRATFL